MHIARLTGTLPQDEFFLILRARVRSPRSSNGSNVRGNHGPPQTPADQRSTNSSSVEKNAGYEIAAHSLPRTKVSPSARKAAMLKAIAIR